MQTVKWKGRRRDRSYRRRVWSLVFLPLPHLSLLPIYPLHSPPHTIPPPHTSLQLSFTGRIYLMDIHHCTELSWGTSVTVYVCCSLQTPRGPIFRTGKAMPPSTWHVGKERRRWSGFSWYVSGHVTDHVIKTCITELQLCGCECQKQRWSPARGMCYLTTKILQETGLL